MFGIFAIGGVYLVLATLGTPVNGEKEQEQNVADFVIVKDIKEYQLTNPMVKLQKLTPIKKEVTRGQARTAQFSYTYTGGSRFESDRLLVQGYDTNEFTATRSFKEVMQFPTPFVDSSTGPIINYFQVTVYQSNNVGAAYVSEGGIGYRKIKIIVEFVDTLFYGINALIYGYNG